MGDGFGLCGPEVADLLPTQCFQLEFSDDGNYDIGSYFAKQFAMYCTVNRCDGILKGKVIMPSYLTVHR